MTKWSTPIPTLCFHLECWNLAKSENWGHWSCELDNSGVPVLLDRRYTQQSPWAEYEYIWLHKTCCVAKHAHYLSKTCCRFQSTLWLEVRCLSSIPLVVGPWAWHPHLVKHPSNRGTTLYLAHKEVNHQIIGCHWQNIYLHWSQGSQVIVSGEKWTVFLFMNLTFPICTCFQGWQLPTARHSMLKGIHCPVTCVFGMCRKPPISYFTQPPLHTDFAHTKVQ